MRAARMAHRPEPLTQSDVAEMIGVAQPMIARWEADNASPPTKKVRKVARVYGLKPEQILPLEDA